MGKNVFFGIIPSVGGGSGSGDDNVSTAEQSAISNAVNSAKSELKGTADPDGDTLGELEDRLEIQEAKPSEDTVSAAEQAAIDAGKSTVNAIAFTQSLNFATNKKLEDYTQTENIAFALASASHVVGNTIAVKIIGNNIGTCTFSSDFVVFGIFDNTTTNYLTFYCHAVNEIWVTVLQQEAPAEMPSDFPTSGLLAYWDFEETTGNFLDKSGNNKSLTRVNEAANTAGKVGSGVNFDIDLTSYLSGPSTGLSPTTGFTIAGWYKSDNNYGNLLQKGSGGTFEYAIYFGNNTITFQFHNGTGTVDITQAFLPGAFRFIVAKWNGSQISLNVNNGTPVTLAVTTAKGASGGELILGNRPGGTSNADGVMDEMGIWNIALTTDEETYLYNSGSGRTKA